MTCTPATRHCPQDPQAITPACCRSHLVHVMRLVAQELDARGIQWWIDYGTLLGALRHGGLIPWDNDIDLGAPAEGFDKLLAAQHALRKQGLAFTYSFRWDYVNVTRSATNGNGLDIFPWFKRADGTYYRRLYSGMDRKKGKDFPAAWIEPRRRIVWEGLELWAPAQAEKLCAHRYGPGWQTPVRYGKEGPP